MLATRQDPERVEQCNCLRSELESLCKLKDGAQKERLDKADTNFATTLNALAASQNMLDCAMCYSDRETLEIIIMCVNLAFRRLQGLSAAAAEDMLEDLQLRFGDQEVSGLEPLSLVRKTLLRLARDKVQQVFTGTKERVARLSANNGGSPNGDVEQMDVMKLQLAIMQLDVIFQRL